jgi:hypothetical protein
MKDEIFDNLEDLLDALDEISCINSGGCGISALAICKVLMERFDVPINDIMISYSYLAHSSASIRTNERYISEGYPAVAPAHCQVYWNDVYIDSHGIDSLPWYTRSHLISIHDLVRSVNEAARSWNSAFDREYGVSVIEDALDIDMSDYVYAYDSSGSHEAHDGCIY